MHDGDACIGYVHHDHDGMHVTRIGLPGLIND